MVKYFYGNFIGIHNDVSYLLRVLKLFRRNALINIFTSFNWDTRFNELFISLMEEDAQDHF